MGVAVGLGIEDLIYLFCFRRVIASVFKGFGLGARTWFGEVCGVCLLSLLGGVVLCLLSLLVCGNCGFVCRWCVLVFVLLPGRIYLCWF